MPARNPKKNRFLIAGVLIALAIATTAVLPPSLGRPPAHVEKAYLEVNGTRLGIFIAAKDPTRPVQLFLGGGPGIPEYFLESQHPTGLENHFVVAYLEYRGTSLSYDADLDPATMTTEQYLADVIEVTNQLRARFGCEKVYLMGHSFGTSIALQAAAQHPDLYHAYVAMAQIVDQPRSEVIAYHHMLERYRANGNEKMVKRFIDTPIESSPEAYERYFSSTLRDTAMHELGVGTTHEMNSVITGIFFPSLRTQVYTPGERINIWRGKAFAQSTAVVADSTRFNAFEQVPRIEIPIYFLAGRHDYTCYYGLQREYFEAVEAPVKAFYTFEDSAHSPLFEEPERARQILTTDVLTESTSLAD